MVSREAEAMSQQPQSRSNETNFSFAPAAPAQAISDTPGSAESEGGGTVSYRAPGSGASSNSFTMLSVAGSHRGSAKRSTSAKSHRLEDPLQLLSETHVAMVRRTRPRVRMRRVGLPPRPSASRLVVLRGMRAKHDYDVNYTTQ